MHITFDCVVLGWRSLVWRNFRRGKFFNGDLFIDERKKCYRDLAFKRYNQSNIAEGMLARDTARGLNVSNRMGIMGNMIGDEMQNGGLLIVAAGGEKVLLSHKQSSQGDHVPNSTILEALGISVQEQGSDNKENTVSDEM